MSYPYFIYQTKKTAIMKKHLSIYPAILLIFIASVFSLSAQSVTSFQLSTSGSPVWYNINSAATAGVNAGLGAYEHTTLGSIIKGVVPVSPATIHPDQTKDAYLWRFENDGSGNVIIVNKLGLKINHPVTVGSGQRVTINAEGKSYTYTAVTGITANGVSGTAFYFTPLDATYANVGRLNCDGSTKEIVLYKAGSNGDIAQTGGKGSLFWLYEVPMKTITVSYTGTGAGIVVVLGDNGDPETNTTVSKAQAAVVKIRAVANVGSEFEGWKNVSTGSIVSTEAEYSYTETADIQLEATFTDVSTSLSYNKAGKQLDFYPNPATATIVCTQNVLKMQMFSQSGQLVKETFGNHFDVSELPSGVYILKMMSKNNSVNKRLIKK